MSEEELKYANEAEKAQAIESFDELKGSPEELQRIMDAKIEPKAETTPPQELDASAKKPVEEKPPAAPAQAEPPAPNAVPVANPDEWAKSKGYASFAEARKAFDEKEELIQKQTRFIKEKIETQSPNDQVQALLSQKQKLEEELNSFKAKPGDAKSAVASSENKIAVLKDALSTNLQKRKALAEELKGESSLAIDGDFMARKLAVEAEKDDLDLRMVEEMTNLRSLLDGTTKQIQDYTTQHNLSQQREQNERLYRQEMDEITEFANNPKHQEFAFSDGKDSEEVEAEYVKWANRIASAVFAGPVNMLHSQQEKAAVGQALAAIKANDPEALNACRVAGIDVEPSSDVKKYLDICELLDHRDGQKLNPITGQMEQQYRLVRDPMSGGFRKDPVRFASLEDAYQHKLAIDGTYAERIKQSYVKGTKDMAAAAQKRAAGPVELGNAQGVSNADAGLDLSPKDAIKELEGIDEAEAMRRKLSGDSTMWDRFQKLLGALDTIKT